MTTRTTTSELSTPSARALIGATAATVALLGGVLLWQVRPTGETATPVATTSMSMSTEGAAPLGGLAEQERDEHEAGAAAAAARVTTRGGMAEFYAEQAPVMTTASPTVQGGMPDRAVLREAPSPVVYLAATAEQAAYALRFSAELNALRAELGQPQVPVGVLVVGAGTTPALDGLPAAPGTRFLDLRGG